MYLMVLDLHSIIHIIDHTDKNECTTLCDSTFSSKMQNIISMDNIPSNTCKICVDVYNNIYGVGDERLARNINQQNILFKFPRKDSVFFFDEKMKKISLRLWSKLTRYKCAARRFTIYPKRKSY